MSVKAIAIHSFYGLSKICSFDKVKQINTLPVIPMYHAVGEEKKPYFFQLPVFREVNQFKRDLEFLLKHYEPVAIDEIHQKGGKPKMHLTFDDGLRECYEVVYPILKAKGIPASFFINTDFLDNKNLFFRFKAALLADHVIKNKLNYPLQKLYQIKYPEQNKLDDLAHQFSFSFESYLQNNPVYLSTEELKKMHAEGFTIGGHSLNHPDYRFLDEKEQIRQTQENIHELRVLLNDNRIQDFAFPFTDVGIKINFWQQNNLRYTFGGSGLKTDDAPNHFHRIPFDKNNQPAEKILRKEYVYFLLKKPFGKNHFKRF